ncbi:glycoside hydrolase family 5 protein [Rariglobus hedericola]|nr:cellulase family glycosylhydrolase [Rariglobus hedericola]
MSPLPLTATRAQRLRRGINLSHWFSQIYVAPGYVPAHFDSYIRVADIALIRDLGFDHVRFPINCEPILAAAAADGTLPADYLARIQNRIDVILDHGLAVIVDIHPEDAFKKHLATQPAALATFVNFWEQFAAALVRFDPERTFFEVLNEPCVHDPLRWNKIQNTLVEAIRRVAPHHTIIITGDQWSLLPDLLQVTPPADRNIIANFHLYDPHVFTHQGAGWVSPWAMFTKGLTYPADPTFIAEFLKRVTDHDARRQLAEYVVMNWNAQVYHDFIQPAVTWAREHGLVLTCNEFGVYKKFAPRASRLAWVHDVSAALSANGIGWTMWDYAGDFSVVSSKDGLRVPDIELLHALGLPAHTAGTPCVVSSSPA